GLGRLYPPLTDETYLRANRSSLPCILRHGLSGEIMVHGISYDSTMPSNPELTALDIAYILTYITNSFGNRGDLISKEEAEESLQSCANEHCQPRVNRQDRKSTRLNSSHVKISYAVFCL